MDLARKVEIAAEAINSISRHDDEDAAVRLAILDRVEAHIRTERGAIQRRVMQRLGELRPVGPAVDALTNG